MVTATNVVPGTTVVTVIATDNSNNRVTCSFNIVAILGKYIVIDLKHMCCMRKRNESDVGDVVLRYWQQQCSNSFVLYRF